MLQEEPSGIQILSADLDTLIYVVYLGGMIFRILEEKWDTCCVMQNCLTLFKSGIDI